MPKKGGYDWIRGFDRFADPVYLTLNQQKKIKTPCGGGLTLFVTGLVLMWFADQILAEIKAEFAINSRETQLSTHGDTTDPYNITVDKLVFATRMQSTNSTVQENIDKYFSSIFVQINWNGTENEFQVYTSASCSSQQASTAQTRSGEGTLDDDQLSLYNEAISQMEDTWKCVDFSSYPDQDLQVQGFSGGNQSAPMKQLLIIQGTCESMSRHTGIKDCVSRNESEEVSWTVQSQVLTYEQLPDAYQLMPGHQPDQAAHKRGFISNGLILDQTAFTSVRMQITAVEYYLSWYSSSMVTAEETYFSTTTSIQNSQYQMKSVKEFTKFDVDAFVVYQLTLDAQMYKETQKRVTILALLSAFGGLMYTLKNIGNAFNKKGSDFAVDNLMMRKLYTVNLEDDPLYQKKAFPEPLIEQKGLFYDYMNRRTSFYYNWKQCCCRCICNSPCCCSCFNFCCKRKDTIADRIFDKTKERLLHEIDLIQILRQLRICAFNNQINLQQYQVSTIPYFSRYRITEDHTVYDKMAEHPGQFVNDLPPSLETAGEESTAFDMIKEKKVKKMVLYGDTLQEVDKRHLATRLCEKFNALDNQGDLQILKNVFGPDFDPHKVLEINSEIKNEDASEIDFNAIPEAMRRDSAYAKIVDDESKEFMLKRQTDDAIGKAFDINN